MYQNDIIYNYYKWPCCKLWHLPGTPLFDIQDHLGCNSDGYYWKFMTHNCKFHNF